MELPAVGVIAERAYSGGICHADSSSGDIRHGGTDIATPIGADALACQRSGQVRNHLLLHAHQRITLCIIAVVGRDARYYAKPKLMAMGATLTS